MIKSYNLAPIGNSSTGVFNSEEENVAKKMHMYLLSNTPVIWRTDFTINDIYVWYYPGSTISSILKSDFGIDSENETQATYVTQNGKRYCISDMFYYLRNASQDQVDISNYLYGYERGKTRRRRFNWSKCLILWKDDFFRIANSEVMDRERMLMLYLGIYADGFQDGVGVIDGYSIADYETFALVATPEQKIAVDNDIKRRKETVSVWTMLKRRMGAIASS